MCDALLLLDARRGIFAGEVARRENPSAHSTSAILRLLSPAATQALNRTLRYEQDIYEAAVVVHDRRCRAHLGNDRTSCGGR